MHRILRIESHQLLGVNSLNTSSEPLVNVRRNPLALSGQTLGLVGLNRLEVAAVAASVALSELPEVVLLGDSRSRTPAVCHGIVGALRGDDVGRLGLRAAVDRVVRVDLREERRALEHLRGTVRLVVLGRED